MNKKIKPSKTKLGGFIMNKKCNLGVNCDVCNCKHNVAGCKCELLSIDVTRYNSTEHHFCKSFQEK